MSKYRITGIICIHERERERERETERERDRERERQRQTDRQRQTETETETELYKRGCLFCNRTIPKGTFSIATLAPLVRFPANIHHRFSFPLNGSYSDLFVTCL